MDECPEARDSALWNRKSERVLFSESMGPEPQSLGYDSSYEADKATSTSWEGSQ